MGRCLKLHLTVDVDLDGNKWQKQSEATPRPAW